MAVLIKYPMIFNCVVEFNYLRRLSKIVPIASSLLKESCPWFKDDCKSK